MAGPVNRGDGAYTHESSNFHGMSSAQHDWQQALARSADAHWWRLP